MIGAAEIFWGWVGCHVEGKLGELLGWVNPCRNGDLSIFCCFFFRGNIAITRFLWVLFKIPWENNYSNVKKFL